MLQLSSIAFVVLYARSLFGYMSNLGLYRKIDLIYNLDSILAIDLFSQFSSKGCLVQCRGSFSNVDKLSQYKMA